MPTGQTNPGHQHKDWDDKDEATQPMVDLPTHKLRLDAEACTPSLQVGPIQGDKV